jgi:hypothetical protein
MKRSKVFVPATIANQPEKELTNDLLTEAGCTPAEVSAYEHIIAFSSKKSSENKQK